MKQTNVEIYTSKIKNGYKILSLYNLLNSQAIKISRKNVKFCIKNSDVIKFQFRSDKNLNLVNLKILKN